MSALGDRIVADGPFSAEGGRPWWMADTQSALAWNELREELIELRARAAAAPLTAETATLAQVAAAMGLRPCPVCRKTWIGPALAECTPCAGREDAAPLVAEVAARSCVVCGARVLAGMLECLRCAGSEDAAAKRAADL